MLSFFLYANCHDTIIYEKANYATKSEVCNSVHSDLSIKNCVLSFPCVHGISSAPARGITLAVVPSYDNPQASFHTILKSPLAHFLESHGGKFCHGKNKTVKSAPLVLECQKYFNAFIES